MFYSFISFPDASMYIFITTLIRYHLAYFYLYGWSPIELIEKTIIKRFYFNKIVATKYNFMELDKWP